MTTGDLATSDAAAIRVTAAGPAGSTCTLTVYSDSGAGRSSGTVLGSLALPTNATGIITATFAAPFQLPEPGVWVSVASFTDPAVTQILWAEPFGVGTGVHTTAESTLHPSALNVTENVNVDLCFWVPRASLRRSA